MTGFHDFHLSAQDVHLHEWRILVAQLRKNCACGSSLSASLDLNRVLGCHQGRFVWGGQNFTNDVTTVDFNPAEGAAQVPVLRATIRYNGQLYNHDVNLGERISNQDGVFYFDDKPMNQPEKGCYMRSDGVRMCSKGF